MQAVSNNAGGLYFLDAPGGTGKTFVVSLILATIRSEQNIALALASSGIAATLLEGGRTAHSALKLTLNVQNYRNHDWLRERAILAPKNIHINAINFQIQAKLPGVVTTYKSIDSVMNQDEAMNYPIEFLNSLEPAVIGVESENEIVIETKSRIEFEVKNGTGTGVEVDSWIAIPIAGVGIVVESTTRQWNWN
ncbi:hypothetical protein EVAR_56994_1 [Eumeta japonica]|uniref:ATP-dependent DNA helicase n=1 Tax=Eumeta variegata TaxID=151549 RepID=A0A4C1Z4S1_EUMVA|nr:hypothetical protein EVAR_56994_1 [Eumeta japonica]